MKDLYRLVNGPWIDTHVIPADRGIDGVFHQLRDQAEQDVREIVETSAGRAAEMYRSFMDVPGITAAGIDPLTADFSLIDAASTPAEFAYACGELDRLGVAGPLGFWIAKDAGSTDAALYLFQAGIALPDEAYYRAPEHAETLSAYRAHVERMLGFLPAGWLGGASISEAAERIVALETDIAAGHWDVVATRDAVKTYNPDLDLPPMSKAFLDGAGVTEGRIVTMMPSFVQHLETLITPERLADWKLLAVWNILLARAECLPPEISLANFDFFETKLSGATEQRARWKRGIELAAGVVGEEIGQLFVERHFQPEWKDELLEMVDYLLNAYQERISNLPWMTPATRNKALEKLSKFRAKIGYPDKWRSYEGLKFSPVGADLLANVRAGTAFLHDYETAKLGKPVDRHEWVTTPQTVNAFYNPVLNDITFPAAILRPPFYTPGADAATNFGAIGAVIGHEIGHGFDDQGSQYDGEGNIESWWSPEDRAAFETLTAKLVKQFQGLIPSVLTGTESLGVNGEFTLGENIGDLGGLGIALVAYRRYLADRGQDFDSAPTAQVDTSGSDPAMEGTEYTALQRFFISWARVWRTAIRPELAQKYLAIDPHSPAEFRCNIICGNIAEFYQAFDVDPNGNMWIEPDQRVTIW